MAMAVVARLLPAITRGFRAQILPEVAIPTRLHCSHPSASSALVQKLLGEPSSRIKLLLDSKESSSPKSFEFSWSHIVKTLQLSSPPKAQLALEWRLDKLLEKKEPDQERYSELITLCEQLHNLPFAMRVFTSMESNGVKPTTDIFNALIAVCFTSGKEVTAFSLFEIMQNSEDVKANSKTYNTFISAYSKSGSVNTMKKWASAKLGSGFSADLQYYESLISGYIAARDFHSADEWYEEMMNNGIIPSYHVLERMLDGYCEQGSFIKVDTFVNNMIESGKLPSVCMSESIVRFYSGSGKVEDLEMLLQRLLSSVGHHDEVLSKVHCGIIKMYAMADRLDDVEYSVGRMLKKGLTFKFADDVEKVICSYVRRSAYDRLEMFLEHINSSYKFGKSTCDLLVAGYRRAGISEKLDSLLRNLNLTSGGP